MLRSVWNKKVVGRDPDACVLQSDIGAIDLLNQGHDVSSLVNELSSWPETLAENTIQFDANTGCAAEK
jgi:hypothetical protein